MLITSENAIMLSCRKLGENSAIVNVMTLEHGMYAGMVKGINSKTKRGIYQIGNLVSLKWQARLAEQLGMIQCELTKPVAALLMDTPLKLSILNAAVAITEKILLEREKHETVFSHFYHLLEALCEDRDYLIAYVRLEYSLLAASGFGLDLASCAATGSREGLIYVSPRSGRAISEAAGKPYHDKMLPLPPFLQPYPLPHTSTIHHIIDGMNLCGYFIRERVLHYRHLKIPEARLRLYHELVEIAK